MKQPTKLIKVHLRQLSVRNNCERNTMKETTELKDSFFLSENKSPGADEINFNIIKYCFGEVCGPFSHSTEHAIAQLADQIYESFENDNYTVGIFADLSKAFDTVDHTVLLKSLKSMELRVQMLPGLDVT